MDETVKVTAFHSCQKYFEQFFIMQGELSLCKNVEFLIVGRNIKYNPSGWQQFIDFSRHSPKAVLLHKGNTLPAIQVICVVQKKEKY
jgi:hypothetical protein